MLGSEVPFTPFPWAASLRAPASRILLACTPTPIHPLSLSNTTLPLPPHLSLHIKRDDMSGAETGGNKIRKLEFLLAEAKRLACDSIITIGGIQSNHCRATAVAAQLAGLESHLILRTSKFLLDQDPGYVGNLLPERMVGARIHLVSKEDYTRLGSEALTAALEQKLRSEGKKPFVIPVGGSNAIGTWGYLNMIAELEAQRQALGLAPFTDLFVASGSGGTTAGLALGNALSGLGMRIWSFGVCDDPAYFYSQVDRILADLGSDVRDSRGLFTAVQAKGKGYAVSTPEELAFVQSLARSQGVILDPVYGGKALFAFAQMVKENPGEWEGRRVLFVHTGGSLGLYDKVPELIKLQAAQLVEDGDGELDGQLGPGGFTNLRLEL